MSKKTLEWLPDEDLSFHQTCTFVSVAPFFHDVLKKVIRIGWYGLFMRILNFDNDNGFVSVHLKFKVFKAFHDILFSLWKILRYPGVKEFIEHLCLVSHQTCTTNTVTKKSLWIKSEELWWLIWFLCRLATELLELNQRENESPLPVEEVTIQINDDYSMLAQSLDDLLADDISDEGFAELESSKVRT